MARMTSFAAVLAVVLAPSARAQDSTPIETDRPDFTEASSLVSAGRFQLESGWTMSRARGTDITSSHSWPEVLLRAGVSSRVEVRLGQSLASVDDGSGKRFTAFEDLYVGAKIALGEQRGMRPQVAVLVQSTVPTGDARLSQGDWLPGGALLAGWETGGLLSYAGGLQVNRLPNDGVELGPSVAIGVRIHARLHGYGEWFALAPIGNDANLPTAHYANGGMALQLTNDAQVDGRIGFGINDHADRVFFGLGISIRR